MSASVTDINTADTTDALLQDLQDQDNKNSLMASLQQLEVLSKLVEENGSGSTSQEGRVPQSPVTTAPEGKPMSQQDVIELMAFIQSFLIDFLGYQANTDKVMAELGKDQIASTDLMQKKTVEKANKYRADQKAAERKSFWQKICTVVVGIAAAFVTAATLGIGIGVIGAVMAFSSYIIDGLSKVVADALEPAFEKEYREKHPGCSDADAKKYATEKAHAVAHFVASFVVNAIAIAATCGAASAAAGANAIKQAVVEAAEVGAEAGAGTGAQAVNATVRSSLVTMQVVNSVATSNLWMDVCHFDPEWADKHKAGIEAFGIVMTVICFIAQIAAGLKCGNAIKNASLPETNPLKAILPEFMEGLIPSTGTVYRIGITSEVLGSLANAVLGISKAYTLHDQAQATGLLGQLQGDLEIMMANVQVSRDAMKQNDESGSTTSESLYEAINSLYKIAGAEYQAVAHVLA